MYSPLNRAKLEAFLAELGRCAKTPGTMYLVGGSASVWRGWREGTADVDMFFRPEPGNVFASISELKYRLNVAVEIVEPNAFVPALHGWAERCLFVGDFGKLSVRTFDCYSATLAKVDRGHQRDIGDVQAMLREGYVHKQKLIGMCEAVPSSVVDRYTSLDWSALLSKVRELQVD